MPTLISSFVAGSEDDLYMPINFLGYARCGSDNRQPSCDLFPVLSRWWRRGLFEPAASVPNDAAGPMRSAPLR
jgi:hypothetical protein